jgi:hypothetical protein
VRFLVTYKPGRKGVPPPAAEEMSKLMEEPSLVATGGFEDGPGNRVRISGASFTVTDGPFTEAKELIGGFAILEVPSREEAIAQTSRFLAVMREGECDVRQFFGPETGDVPGR